METKTIPESGMTFGPFDEDLVFHVEKSQTYKNIEENVKICEFFYLDRKNANERVVILEAKSSSPHPGNKTDFPNYTWEILEKFSNTMQLAISTLLFRHESAKQEVPQPFKKLNLETANFHFILVIRGHKSEWLDPLKSELAHLLIPTKKLWNLKEPVITVINEDIARKRGLTK